MNKFEELLQKYNKTVEDIDFEYSEMSDEELEAKFEELFKEDEEGITKEVVVEVKEETNETPVEENFTKTFSISHEDIKSALYALIAPMEEIDNDWYWISAVYDDSFAYEGCFNGGIYGQKYSKDGDNVALDGERYALHRELLTDSEYASLNEMRSNYSKFEEISQKLAKYEEEPNKMEIINSEDYKEIHELEEYLEFKKQESHFDLSLEEVRTKCDEMLLSYAKTGNLKFSTEELPKVGKKQIPVNKKKTSRYGNLFSKNN